MARPTKQGIDYFPVDTQFDDKIELYIVETGAEGLGILITIWQLIYQNEGYYIANNNDLPLLIKRRVMADINVITGAINTALERGVFDKKFNTQNKILTSKAIQKRYFDASKKKKTVCIVKDYVYNCIDSNDNWVYSCGNATNVNVEVKEEVKEDSFDTFWSLYPRKKNKGHAEKVWKRIKPTKDLVVFILDKVQKQKEDYDWKKENGKYIPYPSTYLNAKGWEDEINVTKLIEPDPY